MRIIRNLRERILKDPAGAAAVALAVLVFLAVAVYAFGSDIRELACNRLQDDSYYYLQPAWNFSRGGIFTFDGEHPTYGFQPLWMIVLAVLARLSPDKILFLRASVALGGFFFCLTGWMLFKLARGWTSGWLAMIAPVLWTANASLLGVYITGKENALYAFLLVFSCIRIFRRMTAPGKGAWLDGVLLGLLVLSRINALIPALLLLAVLGIWGAGSRAERFRSMLAVGAGMLAVIAVWCVYAQISFGAIFPNSGTAKLFGANAALALFLENTSAVHSEGLDRSDRPAGRTHPADAAGTARTAVERPRFFLPGRAAARTGLRIVGGIVRVSRAAGFPDQAPGAGGGRVRGGGLGFATIAFLGAGGRGRRGRDPAFGGGQLARQLAGDAGIPVVGDLVYRPGNPGADPGGGLPSGVAAGLDRPLEGAAGKVFPRRPLSRW